MIENISAGIATRLIAERESEFEGTALQQLKNTLALAGMRSGVGLPDLHPGRGIPVGAAFFCTGFLYPHVIGSDIGCGIGLWQTSLHASRIKRDKLARKLSGLQQPCGGDIRQWLRREGLATTRFDMALGTIGSGNHFAELQQVHEIFCPGQFEQHMLGGCPRMPFSPISSLNSEKLSSEYYLYASGNFPDFVSI